MFFGNGGLNMGVGYEREADGREKIITRVRLGKVIP